MTPLATFFAAVAAMLLIGLVAILVWSLGREQHYDRQIRRKDDEYAEALRRQGELSAQITQLRGEQVKAAQRAKRMEELYIQRGHLIRAMGLDSSALEKGLDSLHGVNAITRIRIGILIASHLNRLRLQEVAQATGGQAETLFQRMSTRLAQGQGGFQQDQYARDLLVEMIDEDGMEHPVKAPHDEEMVH